MASELSAKMPSWDPHVPVSPPQMTVRLTVERKRASQNCPKEADLLLQFV
jgi:hypothetical protein